MVLTFVISYSVAGLFWILGGDPGDKVAYTILGAVYMLIPALSVIIVQKLVHREKIKKDLLISFKLNKWFFVAWLAMPVISLSTIVISLLFPGVSYDPKMTGMFDRFAILMTPEQLDQMQASLDSMPINPVIIIVLQGLLAGITINALVAFGEELGWRGFLVHQFREMKFAKAALLIGFIWGIWHAPLILMGHNYPQHRVAGVFMMIILCILISFVILYITIKSRSVIAAAIMHGTMNATAGLSIMLIKGGNDLTTGMPGLAGFITIGIFLSGFFIYDVLISKDRVMASKISKFI